MKHLLIATAALAIAALPAFATEATFDRNLSVNGRVDLTVSTGSGSVHISRGSGNQVHIFGRVKSSWGGSDERVRKSRQIPPSSRLAILSASASVMNPSQHHHRLRNPGPG